jgi:hypothetical protein
MTLPLLLFMVSAAVLILLLAWAVRPPQRSLSTEEALEALSQERHYARMPQILQSLREDDTEFMRTRGQSDLLAQIRAERKRIAVRYLGYLLDEYRMLVECSRVIAKLAPELSVKGEYEHLKNYLRFVWICRSLQWRIVVGLEPWESFGTLSDMAGTMTLQLEAAAERLGEKAFGAQTSLAKQGSGRAE